MSELTCKRCGEKAPPWNENPYTGSLGEIIRKSICPRCWGEWQRYSVMVINDYRLKPFLPQHRTFLEDQMRQFLNLEPPKAVETPG